MQKHIKNRMIGGYDLNLIVVVGISTLVLVLERYYPLNIDFPRATELIYYLLIPLAAGWLLFRDKPWDYGIRIGRWKSSIILTLLKAALYMFAWEFLFRGYMLFGLEKSMGINAIFVQTIPFVLLHLGKPFLETLFCIPGGFIFGYVAYRTRSFLPCFIIHFGIYAMMHFFTNY
jgi:hypothetical protein